MTYSPEQIDAELSRRGINVPGRPRREYPIEADYRAALVDYMKMSAGRVVETPEPMARAWVGDRLDMIGVRSASGLSTSDFSELMSHALCVGMQEQFVDVTSDIAAVTRTIELADYKPASLAAVGIAFPSEIVEDEEPPRLPFEIGDATTTTLREFGGKCSFSRDVWQTFGSEISNAISNYGRVCGLLELQLLAQVLEAGSPATGSGALATAGLATATTALRVQVNSAGQVTNTPLGALLIPPALEVTARELRFSTNWDFAIAVNPYLTSSSVWYAIGPSVASPLVRLILRGAGKPRLYSRFQEQPGAEFSIRHDCNFALIDAPGLVKMS